MKITANNKEYEPKVSPVYSLEVQSEALFLLSGLNNGGITMQGVRYMEGNISHYFKEGPEGHSNVVNILRPVSYTHLDVYKRQLLYCCSYRNKFQHCTH